MQCNVGPAERVVRILLGVVLLLTGLLGRGALSAPATAIAVVAGLVLLATGGVAFCPLYRILGISTCRKA